MADESRLDYEQRLLADARGKGPLASLAAFVKLSGPGWLQSAITLGGGSLGGSLYLGVLLGFGSMWLQPTAMILGVIMLSAISYVTLSTGRRPFEAINSEISPVLGWAWLIGTMMANMVWCMPQFSLGTGAFVQNLFPSLQGLPNQTGDWIAIAILFAAASVVVWSYNSGSKGVKLFELLLKILVGVVVISFFAVVLRMTFSAKGLPWSKIFAGFIPNGSFLSPAPGLADSLAATGDYRSFWEKLISSDQKGSVITSVATAVGINMTFLMPYSLLRKKWDRNFRGLAIFDLSTGLFVPYLIATSCVVIASAAAFHATPEPGLLSSVAEDGREIRVAGNILGGFNGLLDKRLKEEMSAAEFDSQFGADPGGRTDEQNAALEAARTALPEADRRMAAILVKRDNQQLAGALESLAGRTWAHLIFGIGVLAMAVSTIVILMLINGFALCEALGRDGCSSTFRTGALLAGIAGALGSKLLFTGNTKAWLVVPTSMFGAALLPIAYITFFLMMNSKRLLGDDLPQGSNRLKWNALMLLGVIFALTVCVSMIAGGDTTQRVVGFGSMAALAVLAFVIRPKRAADS